MSTKWLVLAATLPTSPSGLRVRVWRSLKATGAGTLREGVYVLPEHAGTAETFWSLERSIVDAGAVAHLLLLDARDTAQEQSFQALFDRSELHVELRQLIKEARGNIGKTGEAQLHKTLRELESQLQALQRTDFFPGKDSRKTAEAFAALRREVELHLSPDEPAPTQAAIPSLSAKDYQGRTWATRKRPWVDRLATAWLIQRFVDRQPTFTWLADPKKCPRSALGFDFDGAAFTHVGEKVTFEVVAESFGLLDDPALVRFASLVHTIDVGGIPVDEAPGFEMLVRGLQASHADDHALLAAAIPLLDAWYAALQAPHDR
jgi:hypothetical protein